MLTLIPPSSGSIQGITYSHNRGGAYTRKRATPVVGTRTPRQGIVKANMTSASQAWQLLSSVEQGAWISYANGHPIINRLGSSIKLTGSQYFNKCGAALLNAGGILPTLPPVSTVVQPVLFTAYTVSAAPSMNLSLTPGAGGDFVLVAVSKWTSNGVNFNKTYSQVGVVSSVAAFADVMDAWTAFAGNPAVGQKAWVRLTAVNAGGLTGTPLYLQVVVAAAPAIATSVMTSPLATDVIFTWAGAPALADMQVEQAPSAMGPWSPWVTAAAQASPANISPGTSGTWYRAKLIDPATGLAGPWSIPVVCT